MTISDTPVNGPADEPETTPQPQADQRRKYQTLKGEARTKAAKALARDYANERMSIRLLSIKHGMSFGLARTLLIEAGVQLRGRGGDRQAR
ncbi:helix-turn-helix domain-containing protein [Streptomyces roseolus]|uniref:helix-turn-helix domain-containing protein n=1 Tax=Streptomyces roseolus TaxID=67358 RepID=UPI0037A639FF